jgi:hypothetical protein
MCNEKLQEVSSASEVLEKALMRLTVRKNVAAHKLRDRSRERDMANRSHASSTDRARRIVQQVSAWTDVQITNLGIPAGQLDYFRAVCDAAETAFPQDTQIEPQASVVQNRTPDHAAIVLYNLFRVAQRVVNIHAGDLDASVYGKQFLINAAADFLRSNPTASIVVKAQNSSAAINGVFYQTIISQFPNRISVAQATGSVANGAHFAVADETAYRFEYDGSSNTGASFESTVQFRNPEIARKLNAAFASI